MLLLKMHLREQLKVFTFSDKFLIIIREKAEINNIQCVCDILLGI